MLASWNLLLGPDEVTRRDLHTGPSQIGHPSQTERKGCCPAFEPPTQQALMLVVSSAYFRLT